MSDLALVLQNVETFYGKIHALKGVSLEVPKGKIVTLLGSNGAGKTTTLKTISGLIQASAGKIEFYGRDIVKEKAHNIVSMGLIHVPEGRRIFKDLTVKENLELGGFTLKDDSLRRNRIEHVFEMFPRLKDRQKQIGGTLSGGEQQMLAIGRAMITDPKLLLLDEPSMGLAPLIVQDIMRIIKQLNAEGTTVLLVEQNAKIALKLADYGYVLETGELVMEGNSAELRKDERVTKAYLGE
ncbi:ABC-type branched-chain amino acid transport systems, ATPase component [Desulfosporosinus acidiphilus SJ4]|uniref:ABC-type branched-chain amino acid transport systems, ATPase component n=1 Tax=Desulfosporosinus acidiphilus (strain DSM 22704 / JCM 16185 / SJ4) TaxID=646529 RepID=I4D331_DESAJ|nr:ABC transporter ATP-binding protein [Desulfosporosinus acidiphilus]AFM40205.1 ABC-type branched-chain amino acid transport systems, ATPase component [Desulfosporosinus acidiphilus SJ4]